MASRWLSGGPVVARPRTGWVFVFFTMLVTVPIFASAFMPVRSSSAAIATTAMAITVIAYIYFVAPRVVVDEEAVRVENSWRSHVVPWGAIIEVETRFNLTLVTPQGAVHAQAAPSPGGLSAMRSRPDPDRATTRVQAQRGGAVRPGDLPSSLSGSLALVIRGHWQDLVEAGSLDTAARLTTTPRLTHLALTLGGLALSAVLWLLA
ncbi:MAG: PH domain-containing protein [Dermatophilaceae bacterium]|nr:PH domain-containing protein [Intrasporangiaceae bacterium]